MKIEGNTPFKTFFPSNNYVQTYNFTDFPEQFNDVNIRLIKIRAHGKEAIESGWNQKANYGSCDPIILNWVRNGGNYAITSLFGYYCSIDADTQEIQEALGNSLPETYRWSTGKPGHFQYSYYIDDEPVGCIPLTDGAYIKGRGGYALGPGSIHPNGTVYGSKETRDVPIATVRRNELLSTLHDFLISDPEKSKHVEIMKLPKSTTKIDCEKIVKILTPYWKNGDGKRNELTLAIAGFLAHSGGTEADAVFVISELARLTGKGFDHIPGAKYSFHRDGKVRGFNALKRIMEDIENGNK